MNCSYHTRNLAVVQCSRCARFLCPACDHRIRGFPYCQDCIVAGVELLQRQSARSGALPFVYRKTSPFVALLLSFVPGLGAAYNGQTSKAVVHFTIFASFFQMATITNGMAFFVLGIFASWLFAAIDAFRTAQLIRSGLAPDVESDAIARRLYGNPTAWAVLLMTLGAIFLMHTLFGVRLPAREILPVLLMLLGAYMLYDRYRQKNGREKIAFDANNPPPSVVRSSGNLASVGSGDFARYDADEVATRIARRHSGRQSQTARSDD
jgi:hypothetical protein